MTSVAVGRSEAKARPTSPWRLIAYECVAAAICALVIGLMTTALDFGAKMPLAASPGRVAAEAGALLLLGIFVLVALRLQQIRGALHSSLWNRDH